MNVSEKTIKLVMPLSASKEAWIYIFGGPPNAEELQIIRESINVLAVALRTADRTLPGEVFPKVEQPEVERESTEQSELRRPRIFRLKPPCLLHPDLGPQMRSPTTNRCAICHAEHMQKARAARGIKFHVKLTEDQKAEILARYPSERIMALHLRMGISVEKVRGVLIDAGHNLGKSAKTEIQQRRLRQM